MTPLEEIKPCPFCGFDAELSDELNAPRTRIMYYVFCTFCECRTMNTAFPKDAIESWNSRVSETIKENA